MVQLFCSCSEVSLYFCISVGEIGSDKNKQIPVEATCYGQRMRIVSDRIEVKMNFDIYICECATLQMYSANTQMHLT